ncbi:hypothetical protein C8R43DRAFT_1111792 [Mycena crocata]|nr:hypothetical protein C8R43DRAFT_1111792 [Mycena crocata]
MAAVPPEVLMRMASFVKDDETLHNLGLATHQLNAIVSEELTRNKYWKKAEDVEPRLALWADNPRRHRVKELNFKLVQYDHNFVNQRRIFTSLHIFPNLSSLTIRNGRITAHIHTVVTHHPNLRRLRLQWCSIYAVGRSTAPPSTPFTVKSLLLHEVRFVESTGNHGIDIQDLDPSTLAARNLSLMPLQLLAGLESLSISSDRYANVVRQAYAILPSTPNLLHLSVTVLPAPLGSASAPLPALAVSALTTFRGPHAVALGVVASAVRITEVVLTDELNTVQALDVIKKLHPAAVRNVELTLTQWDAEVLYEIAHRFLACKRVRIVHRYQAPSDDFLRDVGVHYFPCMSALDTLIIHARPDDAVHKAPNLDHYSRHSMVDYVEAEKEWEEDGRAGLHDVPRPLSKQVRSWWQFGGGITRCWRWWGLETACGRARRGGWSGS